MEPDTQKVLLSPGSHHYWQYVTILLVGGGDTLWDNIVCYPGEQRKYWVI